MQNLVIVESPTKARTLTKILGPEYQIEASMGHIRDLPKGDLGVDLENNFEPKYVIPRDKRKHVNMLKKLADKADTLWLATDPDREGEAISWHIAHILNDSKTNPKPMHRVVFHEITESAIQDAFKHPRDIDLKLVDAQQARRVLDRLVGYKLSPVLWEKVKRGLSAGRVQSVALRLVVEREREIQAFAAVEYWSIEALLKSNDQADTQFTAAVIEHNNDKLVISTADQAQQHVSNLESAEYRIIKITQRDVRRQPAAPFTTSTLQQTAGNRLGFSAKKTMMVAQNLYEQGFITYMRTDSVNLSTQAISGARDYIKSTYGDKFLPSSPRQFKSKVKNAQEAHEAIRPSNPGLHPDQLEGNNFTRDHKRLYELIWKRLLASQMAEALMKQTTVDVEAKSSVISHQSSDEAQKSLTTDSAAGLKTENSYKLRASGSVIQFEGWLTLYGKDADDADEPKDDTKEQRLPDLKEGEGLKLLNLDSQQHFTEPPPRYTESSLVKKLEELGIGRPSTYAPILSTIQDRYYVEKQEKKFVPTPLGTTVTDFLLQHFPQTFDYAFTAEMEESLDQVSRGEREWKSMLAGVYNPLEIKIAEAREKAEKVILEVETSDKICPECGKPLIVRTGKYGKFLACSGFPDCKHTEQIETMIEAKCPQDGGDLVVRRTRTGKVFYGCKNYPKCTFATWTKPKTAGTKE